MVNGSVFLRHAKALEEALLNRAKLINFSLTESVSNT